MCRNGANAAANPGPDTFLPQVAVYLWTYAKTRDIMTISVLRSLLFLSKHEGVHAINPEREAFMQQAIIEGTGPDAFFSRCKSELEKPPPAGLGGDFFQLVGTLVQVSCSPVMLPHLGDHEPLHLLTNAIDKAIKRRTIADVHSLEEAFVAIHVLFRYHLSRI